MWDTGGEKVQQVFARQAYSMQWEFVEGNPFSSSTGNFLGQVEYLTKVLERVPARPSARVVQADAVRQSPADVACIATDPPYYDNVPYADLADYFYVWLRQGLQSTYPQLFSTLLTPKSQELVADSVRHGGREPARDFFEAGLRNVFGWMATTHDARFPLTLFYAFRQSETEAPDDESGGIGAVSSTGWESMLQALVDTRFMITGTWPIRTEQPGGLREQGRNALASSIVLVCRPTVTDAVMATRKEFLASLRKELPVALRALQHGAIAPVDLAQASIGPGMAVFSRHSRVLEADGTAMRVRTALGLINQVLDEVLTEQEGEYDAATRWAIAWFDQHGMDSAKFGIAETLSKAKNVSVDALHQDGILEAKSDKVRLLKRQEMKADWDPETDRRLTIWEVCQYIVRELENEGEVAAARLLRKVGTDNAERARDLAYRLYSTCERRNWASEGLAYNALVVAWPELVRLASGESAEQTRAF
jgi:putative DNA methylase